MSQQPALTLEQYEERERVRRQAFIERMQQKWHFKVSLQRTQPRAAKTLETSSAATDSRA